MNKSVLVTIRVGYNVDEIFESPATVAANAAYRIKGYWQLMKAQAESEDSTCQYNYYETEVVDIRLDEKSALDRLEEIEDELTSIRKMI